MDEGQYYTHKDGSKTEFCKKCMTMHIVNDDPDTYLWLLEKMDVPYIKEEWDSLLQKAIAKNGPYKLTGMSVFGKYLSKMKLKQWSQYSWEDTEKLAAAKEANMKVAVANSSMMQDSDVLKEMLDAGEISEAEYKTLSEDEGPRLPPPDEFYPENHPGYLPVSIEDVSIDLTDEDKIYLAMKWGRLYTPADWLAMEKQYQEYTDYFDIESASRKDTLIKICKTSLKMNEAIDCGDTEGFLKLTRVYDVLTKSGKFSEAQNKETDRGFVNSIGELVLLCETEEGFIPRFPTDVPQDIVDATIKDMNRYTYNLVTKEMGLGQLIEDALKKIEIQKQMEEDELTSEMEDIEKVVLEDADYEEYFDEIEAQKLADELHIGGEQKKGDE